MDGTLTVTSHLKPSTAHDGVTWNSHCKHSALGPILPFPSLEMMLDVPGALLGQVVKILAQNQQGKDSKHGGALHKGLGQGAHRDKSLPQLGGFGAEHGQPSSPELKQDFREICGIFSA